MISRLAGFSPLAAILLAVLPSDGRIAADAPPASGTIMGIVRDAAGPVGGATVRVQGTNNVTRSAADGSFALSVSETLEPITVTAWREGYLVGWASVTPPAGDVTIEIKPHYTTDNADYEWFSFEGEDGSRTCGKCMPVLFDQWRRDAHAQSGINPRFLSMFRGTDLAGNRSPLTRHIMERDYGRRPLAPDLSEPYFGPGHRLDFPETAGNCATCHVPGGASKTQAAYATFPDEITGIATEGIFCEFCHKIGAVELDPHTGRPFENMPGVLSMRLFRPHGQDQELFFGTLDDVTRRVTRLPLEQESAFCAPCHSARFWDTTIYDSYGEWLDSPYSDSETGQTCQDCHMPATDDAYITLPEKGGIWREPGFFSNHRMLGVSDAEFIRDALTLALDVRQDGNRILVEIRVTNEKVGHHIPTGHPARNMLLIVEATDRHGRPLSQVDGRRIPRWGGLGDDSSAYAGRPGKGYAKVLENAWTGVWPTVAYWNPTVVRDDTRIPARATDVTHYEFRAPEQGGPVDVLASLVFRRAFRELAEQKKWDDPDILILEAESSTRE